MCARSILINLLLFITFFSFLKLYCTIIKWLKDTRVKKLVQNVKGVNRVKLVTAKQVTVETNVNRVKRTKFVVEKQIAVKANVKEKSVNRVKLVAAKQDAAEANLAQKSLNVNHVKKLKANLANVNRKKSAAKKSKK